MIFIDIGGNFGFYYKRLILYVYITYLILFILDTSLYSFIISILVYYIQSGIYIRIFYIKKLKTLYFKKAKAYFKLYNYII